MASTLKMVFVKEGTSHMNSSVPDSGLSVSFLSQPGSQTAEPVPNWLSNTTGINSPLLRTAFVVVFILSIPFLVNYAVIWLLFQFTHRTKGLAQIPPSWPYAVPLLGNTISFIFDGANFIKSASSYAGEQTPVSIALLTDNIYLFQGTDNITAIWKQRALASAVYIHSIGLRYVFGMSQKSVDMYTADDSGSSRKPNPKSNVKPNNRVDFLTHEGLLKGFSGTGLAPTFARFVKVLTDRLYAVDVGSEWIELPDLLVFFQDHVSVALIEAIYGPALVAQNPDFVRNLWAFDRVAPSFLKRPPRFLFPKMYQVRDAVLLDIKRWHAFARKSFKESDIYADGDGDPYWGSELMRYRQKTLLGMDNQDLDSVAATDLGLVWASVTNTTPAIVKVTLEVFRDQSLLWTIRDSLKDAINSTTVLSFDIKKLENKPHLLSVYAETLRLIVQVYITGYARDSDLKINNWILPKAKVAMVNTWLAHRDENVWNTKQGTHPLDQFWAERFLIDPKDPSSGPLRKTSPEISQNATKEDDSSADEPRFSMDGLEGAWIPYGGGHRACPGRLLAKRAILLTCAMMVTMFDVEILAHEQALKLDSRSFGMGVQKPSGKVPFRIRRREMNP